MLYKYVIFIWIFITLFSFYKEDVFADAQNCEVLNWFERYECQSSTHCEKYKPEDITYKVIPFVNTPGVDLFDQAKETYRENQNSIYACSVIKIQENTLNTIEEKLIKIDKSWTLSSNIQRKIELQLNKLTSLWKNQDCNITDTQTIYAKKDVLTESMYQLCQYSFYLEYMKDYYTNIQNVLETRPSELQVQTYWISYIARAQALKQEEIVWEFEHSKMVFEMAFQAYIWYETNLWVHLLLELIKQDLIVYREKLHKAISPITQVVYKINNAMSTN